MQSLFFWKHWPANYRFVWYGAAGVFIITLIFLWISYFKGNEGVIHWDKMQEQKVVETAVHTFKLGPFELNVPGESYVIFEYFNGSAIHPNTTASYFFLVALITSALLILSIITVLDRFWFYVGMGLFILFLASLRLEVLGLFGHYDQIPVIAAMVLYILPTFYFNRFATSASFVTRLLLFSGITVAIGLVVHFFSDVDFPMYHLTLTAYPAALILSVIFIITVAHEIMASFVSLVSRGGSKSLRHLSIITVIYIVNLFFAAFYEMGVIEWKFIYINLYLLLTCSAILGIWGFRDREVVYGNITPFYPFGAYLFLALGAICFATLGQLVGNDNDPAVGVIRYVIIFSHTAYSIIFAIYLISNFILMLGQSIPVHKVLYKPTRMPYFTYRFAGFIVTLAFIFYLDWHTVVYKAIAGFHNTTGDLYALMENDVYAESFYEQGRLYGFMNHHSNYALATLKSSRFDFEAARENYDWLNNRTASAFSRINSANTWMWESNIFEAITSYRSALPFISGSGILENNLGLAYAKVHNLDSSLYYLGEARDYSRAKESAEINFFALSAMESLPFKADSIVTFFGSSSPGVVANAMVLSTLFHEPFSTQVDPLANRKVNLHTATLLNNYIMLNAKSLDTTFVTRAYAIADDSLNADYSEALKASLAFAYYHQGNVSKALEILAGLVYLSQSHQGKFNYIMGLWALEQGNPELASSYFTYADTYDYKDAKFYNAIALTEARDVDRAMEAWNVVLQGTDSSEMEIASSMQRILSLPVQSVLTLSDADKYQFCRYRIGTRDSLVFNRIAETFENTNYKAQALLDISRRYYDLNQYAPAIRYFNRIAGLELTDRKLYDEVQHTELLMLASRGELRLLADQINKGVTFDASQSLEKLLYTALMNSSGGDAASAKKHFEILGKYNPYFEEGIIGAALFFRDQNPEDMKAYNILAEAIQINANSYRLLSAYVAEATRKGFDDYAASALQRLRELENQ